VDQRFAEAWFNTDHRVLGRRLHPFCLEDALILSVAESPFLLGSDSKIEYTLPDLQLAAEICSSPAKIFLHARFNRSWLARVRTVFWARRCKKTCATQMGLKRECQLFTNYIDDYYSVPEVWHDESGNESTQLNAPWILGNFVFLLRRTTYRAREIWTMPIGQALWIAAALAEQTGHGVQIVGEEEADALKEMGLS
jgi:hypothetical protein